MHNFVFFTVLILTDVDIYSNCSMHIRNCEQLIMKLKVRRTVSTATIGHKKSLLDLIMPETIVILLFLVKGTKGKADHELKKKFLSEL